MSMEDIINKLDTVKKSNEAMKYLLKQDKSLFKETDFEIRNELMAKLEESIFE